MEENVFFKELFSHLDFPFSIEDVQTIDSNCGTVWIELKNGKTYFLVVQPCESSVD